MTLTLDRKIVSALQINPRIPWSRLSEILGSDSKTLSQRWTGLLTERKAWSSFIIRTPPPQPNRVRVAYVDLTFDPRQRDAVIESLKEQPLIYGLKSISGERGLQVEVVGDSLPTIDELIHRYVATCPGVKGFRLHFLHTIYLDGTQWRMRSLDSYEDRAVRATLPATRVASTPNTLHRELVLLLDSNPRISVNEASRSLGVSPATASRNINTVLASSWASHRVDVAHTHLGWEAEALLWLQGDLKHFKSLIPELRSMFDLRMAASTSGTANIMTVFWLRRITDVDDIQNWFHQHSARIRIFDRWLAPRVWKRFGTYFDADGLREGATPVGVSTIRML